LCDTLNWRDWNRSDNLALYSKSDQLESQQVPRISWSSSVPIAKS
jgi:hypothetical protein